MNRKRHYIIQFGCILAVLTAIMLQGFTKVVKLKPLKGFSDQVEKVDFSSKTYLDGSYQEFLTRYAKENTGFREFFIRNYNQIAYSCFDKITNENIIKGQENELFLKFYLDEVIGKTLEKDFGDVETAKATARNNIEVTQALIDTLKAHGKDFLFVFAPTKTAVYPEKMPQYYRNRKSDFFLEEYYIELFKENGIPHIDFYHYFKSIKDTISFPLYSKYGSHWAQATIPFVADSILHKLEAVTHYKFPTIQCIDPNITTDYFDYDCELEGSLNLLFPLKKPAIPNPVFVVNDTTGWSRPNLLVIGDSYYDQLMFSSFSKAFNHWDFWQYNLNVYSSRGYYREPMETVFDAPVVLQEADIVLAIFTAPMLYTFLFDFPNSVHKMLEIKDTDMLEMMAKIHSIPEWYDAVVKQAEEKGISIEENLRINAEYVLESQRKESINHQ